MGSEQVDDTKFDFLNKLRGATFRYQGINAILLWSASVMKGHACPLWLTFKQALELGGNVRHHVATATNPLLL